ncbi:hypothetical protein [Hyphomonas sp.]|uniref:hypothetical protein n=1 Tax=Hyphomonas sp. TaxID=87 RepID=UPI0025C63F03|nr:hypothetical protein [Hyphomonas sp.]
MANADLSRFVIYCRPSEGVFCLEPNSSENDAAYLPGISAAQALDCIEPGEALEGPLFVGA